MRIDQPRGNQRAAKVLDLVNVDDVIDDPGQTGRQLIRGTGPRDPIILHQDRGIADYFGASPQSTDIGEKTYHRQAPSIARVRCLSSLPSIMITPCLR